MGLIIVKERSVLSIPDLFRAALKFIYDEENMSLAEIRRMQESIIDWKKAIDLEMEKLAAIQAADMKVFGRPITTEHKYSEEEFQLGEIALMLEENAEGKFEKRKQTFKAHRIDYRKFHGIPGASTPEEYARAAEMKAEYDRKNPEQEGLVKR